MKKKKSGKNFLKEQYKESWNYLKISKNFIYFAIGIFSVFLLLGFFVPVSDSLTKQILDLIEELLEKTKDMSHFELIEFIFVNNFQTSFMGMILGFLFGVFPMILIIFNGYLLGFVASMSVEIGGPLVLWRILPHGIFELPAVFISLGLGLKFGMFIFQEKKADAFKEYLLNSLRVFLFIVVPLLFIAAIIESSLIYFMK